MDILHKNLTCRCPAIERRKTASPVKGKKKKGLITRIKSLSAFEWTMVGTGVAIIVMAIILLSSLSAKKTVSDQMEEVYGVGQNLAGIGIAGESGLLAMADAKGRAIMIRETVSENETGTTDTEDENALIPVKVTFTSLEKDLKVKFINSETDRLITDVIFEVVLIDANGKETVLRDEDLDGIIYEKDIAAGDYEVRLTDVEGYEFVIYDSTVTVKKQIVYQQIDVTQEIKSESEVNVAQEDTAVNNVQAEEDAVEEPKIQDTVTYVDSTRTPVDGTDSQFTQIDKSAIAEPSYASRNVVEVSNEVFAARVGAEPGTTMAALIRTMLRTSENSVDNGENTENSETPTPTPKEEETPTPTPTSEANESETPTPTPTSGPSASPTASPTPSPTPTPTATPTISPSTVTGVTLEAESLTIVVGMTGEIRPTAKMADNSTVTTLSSFTYQSADEKVATVSSEGRVNAVATGTVEITVSYKDSSGNVQKAVCRVTVKQATIEDISLNKSSLSLAKDSTETLTATAKMSDGADSVTDGAKFSWSSSNTSVATVDKGVVTAVGTGTATITASFTDLEGTTRKAVCEVTVVNNASGDTSTRLYDKSGNQVYIKNSEGQYLEAVYADYYTASAFYIKTTTYNYTGWQTIEGNVYYFDQNGNKVTGDQIIQGVKYHFTDDGILAMDNNGIKGIDVSKWNGNIDWTAVKNSGINFVIIRCGYRGSSTGVLVEDSMFRSNIQGAKAVGLKVGIYFFTQAISEAEAVEEASMVLSLISGYGVNYPIFIDTERANGRADGLDRATRTAVCRAFCETIRNGGYTAGVYASKAWFNDNLNYSSLSGYKIWLAQYASEPSFGNRYDMWQYSEKGSVSGISGKVDMNISYMGY